MGTLPSTAALVLLLPGLAHRNFLCSHLPSDTRVSRVLAFLTGFHYASQAAVESSCLCSVRALGLHLHPELKIHIQLSRQQAHFGHHTDTTSTCWKLETESTIPSLSFPSFQPPNSPSREARSQVSLNLSLVNSPQMCSSASFLSPRDSHLHHLRQLLQILPLRCQYQACTTTL